MGYWLVTLTHDFMHAEEREEVLTILKHRLSPTTVARIVEHLYASRYATYFEQFKLAKNRKNNPFRARFDRDLVTCGDNPLLKAREVKNLAIENEVTANGLVETVTWLEPMADGEPVKRSIKHKGAPQKYNFLEVKKTR